MTFQPVKKRKVMAVQTEIYLLKAKRRVELLGADHLEDQQKKRVCLVDEILIFMYLHIPGIAQCLSSILLHRKSVILMLITH